MARTSRDFRKEVQGEHAMLIYSGCNHSGVYCNVVLFYLRTPLLKVKLSASAALLALACYDLTLIVCSGSGAASILGIFVLLE